MNRHSMNRNSGTWMLVGLLLVLTLVIWEVDFKPWSNEYTTHVQRKTCSGSVCKWSSDDRRTWRISEATSEVIYWNEDKDPHKLITLHNCIIENRKNWECPPGRFPKQSISDGDYWIGTGSHKSEYIRNTSKFEWWLNHWL